MMNKGDKMKSEKGITMLSITIYMLLLTVVVGAFAIVRTHFQENIGVVSQSELYESEFNKLNGFLVQDAKRNYNVGTVQNRDDSNTEKPHTGTSEQKPVAAIAFGNGNVYLYYGNSNKGTVFSEGYEYLDQGVFKYTNQGRVLKVAGGVTDFSVETTEHGIKKLLVVGMEVVNGKTFTNLETPMRYTLKYW